MISAVMVVLAAAFAVSGVTTLVSASSSPVGDECREWSAAAVLGVTTAALAAGIRP